MAPKKHKEKSRLDMAIWENLASENYANYEEKRRVFCAELLKNDNLGEARVFLDGHRAWSTWQLKELQNEMLSLSSFFKKPAFFDMVLADMEKPISDYHFGNALRANDFHAMEQLVSYVSTSALRGWLIHTLYYREYEKNEEMLERVLLFFCNHIESDDIETTLDAVTNHFAPQAVDLPGHIILSRWLAVEKERQALWDGAKECFQAKPTGAVKKI